MKNLIAFFNEWQIEMAWIFGAFLQFLLREKQTPKIFITVMASSVMVGIYIIPIVVSSFGIEHHSAIERALYSLSSLLSIEILGLLIVVMPGAIQIRLKEFLGVNEK